MIELNCWSCLLFLPNCACDVFWGFFFLPPPSPLFLQDYPKLSQSYYSLLEVLTQDHMNFIASLEPHVVLYILSSISEGLTALGERKTYYIYFTFSFPIVSLFCLLFGKHRQNCRFLSQCVLFLFIKNVFISRNLLLD